MQPLVKRWRVAPSISEEVSLALKDFPPVIRQILSARGYPDHDAAINYLSAYPPEGCEPENMLGMNTAVQRLCEAISKQESIAVYGDYDVDGVTATSVLVQIMKRLGAKVDGYIPKRDDGYGVNNEAIAGLREQGIDLIVTVDCGIRSPGETALAHELGMDMIITDHHQPGDILPPAIAIINPKQAGDVYIDKDLSGVGLAYKLASALVRYLKKQNHKAAMEIDPEQWLDLVALGTVADLVPLVGENRALVRSGLRLLRQTTRPGMRALIGVAGIHAEQINAGDIGYILGPRLNAAGRLDTALDAYTLLTTPDLAIAGRLAQKLDDQNRERQRKTREIQEQAERIALAENPDSLLLFAADPEFLPGVIGLAASRLVDTYYRPAIVAQRGEVYTRASCRSISGFHITRALDECSHLLEHHGGHAAAAGFTVRNELVDQLVTQLRQIVERELAGKELQPVLEADGEVRLVDIHPKHFPKLLQYLDYLQPTGYSNGPATFVTRNLEVKKATPVGRDGSHLKLWVTDGSLFYDAIAFRQGHKLEMTSQRVDLLYTVERNEYNGMVSWQMNVRDFKPSGLPD